MINNCNALLQLLKCRRNCGLTRQSVSSRSPITIAVIGVTCIVVVGLLTPAHVIAKPIQTLIEDFALAPDRTKVLAQLIPGSDDYYFYHCLYNQHEGDLDKVDSILKRWIKQHYETARVREIQNRQALLRYEKQPQKTLEFLRKRLGLRFDHQKETTTQANTLPSQLSNHLISRKTLTNKALRHRHDISKFEDKALDWLITQPLSPSQRHALLKRLKRPDHAKLVQLIKADLDYKYSRGFGSLPIHKQLLLPQLNVLLQVTPELLNESNFVHIYLSKLRPNADIDVRFDNVERKQYLARLWQFVNKLNATHNSLKAHIIHQQLVFDRSQGIYDKQLFLDYLKLPRNAVYTNRKHQRKLNSYSYAVDFNADYSAYTSFPKIHNDETLVRDILQYFLLKEKSYKTFLPYIDDHYLKELFAETMIVNDIGDREHWYAMLPHKKYEVLKERVDLDFAITNKQFFHSTDAVTLDLYIKNVKTLLIKIYKINGLNYYRKNLHEIDTAINLDGLIPNHEIANVYEDKPFLRIHRSLRLPMLDQPGIYVVDFIGNGKSSRALIHKGRLHYLVRTGSAGHVFTILNATNSHVNDAELWMQGHQYKTDDSGEITVPFAHIQKRQPIILTNNDLTTLAYFNHQTETYELTAGFYVDPESVLSQKKATVIVRGLLKTNGISVSLALLQDVTLIITAIDHDNVETAKTIHNFQLFADRESTYEFQVPNRLRRLQFELKAQVKNLSLQKKQDLRTSMHYDFNGIEHTDKIDDLYLARFDDRYALDLLGKTGEVKAGKAIRLNLKHEDFKRPVHVTLTTNDQGRIDLGTLSDIAELSATAPNGTTHRWQLQQTAIRYPNKRHGQVDQTIQIPYLGKSDNPSRFEFSLLERRGNTFVRDRFRHLTIANGMLHISGLQRGDYQLVIKDSNHSIDIRIAAGNTDFGYILGDTRHLEQKNANPLNISTIDVNDETIDIHLQNANAFTRVHVLGKRFFAQADIYSSLIDRSQQDPNIIARTKKQTIYLTGRNIGEEYRYILDRKYAKKFPGNRLNRPSLLLSPWAVRKTATDHQEAAIGDSFAAGASNDEPFPNKIRSTHENVAAATGFSSYDFLHKPASVMTNLTPTSAGIVRIKRADLQDHQLIQIVAINQNTVSFKQLPLPPTVAKYRQLQLLQGLNSKSHFTEQKGITDLHAGQTFTIDDITTSSFETYNSLQKVYSLYSTLNQNAKWRTFGFILDWPDFTADKKQEMYSKYACHELNFFLHHKDPVFFNQIIKPFLRNKKDKTFMDHWLLEDPLANYRDAWKYGRLNTVERILLAQRDSSEAGRITRFTNDQYELIPPDNARATRLFETAIKGRELDADNEFLQHQIVALEALVENPQEYAMQGDYDMPMTEAEVEAKDSKEEEAYDGEMADEVLPTGKSKEHRRHKQRSFKSKKKAAKPGYFRADMKRRERVKQLYRQLDKTKEWAENNYYQLPIEKQIAELVTINAFWRDYAKHQSKSAFYSINLAEATHNFTEMMFALAVLDLPFKTTSQPMKFSDKTMSLNVTGPTVLYYKQLKPAPSAYVETPILVNQNFFRRDDRYAYKNNRRFDKFVTGEFLIDTVYGCRVVLTNPTSSPLTLNVLVQIPKGAIPVVKSRATHSLSVDLKPYNTHTIEYFFYFPYPGDYAHYPVHVAKAGQLIAYTDPHRFNVVKELSEIDTQSWAYVSQHGSDQQVLDFLRNQNINRLNLEKIAFRLQERTFFNAVITLLNDRHIYSPVIWSYGIKHNELDAISQYLLHADNFIQQTGTLIDSKLLSINPIQRYQYQHLEYLPLVNARTHTLGKRPQILNERFYLQYHNWLRLLTYKRSLTSQDLLVTTYYMLLQNRIAEAITFFQQIDAKKLDTAIQFDYLKAYLAFYQSTPLLAEEIAKQYQAYPVQRWRLLFASILAHLDEIKGQSASLIDNTSQHQQHALLASMEPGFDFKVAAQKIILDYRNISACIINYYLMDLELLFSKQPFAKELSGQFRTILPNLSQTVSLPASKHIFDIDLPTRFAQSNMMIEVVASGKVKSRAYYAHSHKVHLQQNYGQLQVTDKQNMPLTTVYVKAYAKMQDGSVRFYKDGYTDLAGQFDYTSLNTDELNQVNRFSLLVLSDQYGAEVLEVEPPKQ